MFSEQYDVIVVGGGHAGAEAASAAARMGVNTLLITQNIDTIGQMSCNPAMGGVAKGQIVREIDALGGLSGIVTDQATIQFRMLNRSKGPAMWSPRAQCDKWLFSSLWRNMLLSIPNLSIWQDEVVSLRLNGSSVRAVVTKLGIEISTRSVVLTNGTFLNGSIFIGEISFEGGRIGERSTVGLSECLLSLGFTVNKLKTGTPVRIDARSIDFSRLEIQQGDDKPSKFSFSTDTRPVSNQVPCYIAHTNNHTHDILRLGFDKSPLFTGRIKGVGPRYCPSIEDKIDRFSSKDSHQLFVEPEGRDCQSYYLNGFSSSLPFEIQLDALHSIVGFENARVLKPGYAIEYDYFPPTQLKPSLETISISGLFFAGQINGTTGYEEAACQGLMAGINAALLVKDLPPFVMGRSDSYIGVLIDDLITKGVDEPYRMFTSRAEHRILLRQDNADFRLSEKGYALGLLSEQRLQRVEQKKACVDALVDSLSDISVIPSNVNPLLVERQSSILQQKVRLHSLLLRPELSIFDMLDLSSTFSDTVNSVSDDLRPEVLEQVEAVVKYARYIEKEQSVADKIRRYEDISIPADFDFLSLNSLSFESREKLAKFHPATVGQALRISGVSPADVAVLLVSLGF